MTQRMSASPNKGKRHCSKMRNGSQISRGNYNVPQQRLMNELTLPSDILATWAATVAMNWKEGKVWTMLRADWLMIEQVISQSYQYSQEQSLRLTLRCSGDGVNDSLPVQRLSHPTGQ